MGERVKLGDRASQFIEAAIAGGVFVSASLSERRVCTSLNGRGLLSRDKKDADTWYPTEKAKRIYDAAKALVAIANDAPAPIDPEPAEIAEGGFDASGLAEVVSRARALLDDGDVMAARLLAGGAYDQAKAAAQFAARFGAAERLVGKARRLQADALLIEARAKMRLADEWDRAAAEGKTLKGRPKSVPDENAFTAKEAGLTRKEIHEARKLSDAEKKSPGLVERAIEARLAEGLEPSRANLRAAVGTTSATKEERGNNLYETPDVATLTLLALEKFGSKVKEPACGRGAIARVVEAAGYTVTLSDLIDYGTADQFGEVQSVEDFLESEADPDQPDIITNPPYGALLNRFVAHALRVHRPRKMALLLNSIFLFGFEDPEREFALEDCRPSRVIVFKRRLPMMHRDGWDGPEANSRMNTMWLVWELNDAGIYDGEMRISRVDWKDYADAVASEIEEAA